MLPFDEELFQRIQGQDQLAFNAIYTRYAASLRSHLRHILREESSTEDVLQEVFLRLWTQAAQWDGRGTARGWLFHIATNQALNQRRSMRRRRQECLLGCAGVATKQHGQEQAIQHGLRDGISPDELCILVSLGRAAVYALYEELEQLSNAIRNRNVPQGYGLLARAMRSHKPGAVLARAAAAGERDTLSDPMSRLWVGLVIEDTTRSRLT